jgi:K+/H+ antiporter YhaU regulatory subunit KhtT
MSSRSLLAARARRAGENPPPVSGNRPGTSIGSHAAFAQQPGYQTNMPLPPPNVRVARGQPVQQQKPQNSALQQVKQSQQQAQNSLPFSKLSISDAIGLITLRLGRVEQWVIETEHDNSLTENKSGDTSNLPENSRIIDNSILSSIINRLETVEKMPTSESTPELASNVAKLTEQLTRIGDDVTKHTMEVSKHTEQLFKFNRELVETKDILKTFMIKYDQFVKETGEKFADYEVALTDLEKTFQQPTTDLMADGTEMENINISGYELNQLDETNNLSETQSIMSIDLKNIIKQELASNP